MREQGFQYVAPDYRTVRRGMIADKTLPGMTEKQFINQYGFGLSTLYTGVPPQLAQGYSPAKIGLGRRNVEIYKSLSTADQAAYNRALLGEDHSATFAVSLEQENLSRTGGCTRAAIEKVFTPGQLNASYYNPKDALINKDPRMKAALRLRLRPPGRHRDRHQAAPRRDRGEPADPRRLHVPRPARRPRGAARLRAPGGRQDVGVRREVLRARRGAHREGDVRSHRAVERDVTLGDLEPTSPSPGDVASFG
jgi:hypothetical protein